MAGIQGPPYYYWPILARSAPLSQLLERLTEALVPRYRVVRLVGCGGMAHVYLAEELHPRRQVAIKVLDPDLAIEIGPVRFLREVELASKLAHPHILPIFAAGEADGLLYYVMPFAEEESLRTCLNDRQPFPLRQALQIACEVADALAYAHAHSVIHRDIKPENILLSGNHALVADFGIARPLNPLGVEPITLAGSVVGTPAYMSPEQMLGMEGLDGRTDIYALGCVLFEMVTGTVAFSGATPQAILLKKLGVVPRLEFGTTESTHKLQPIIDRALADDPDSRFEDAGAFRDAIREIITPAAIAIPRLQPTLSSTKSRSGVAAFLNDKVWLTGILGFMLLLNWAETSLEELFEVHVPLISELQRGIVHSMQWIELDYSFAGHDVTNGISVYGYSAAYFLLFPILFVAIGLSLAARTGVSAYRVYVTSAVLNYLFSLPFFLLFPVPERWSFPESAAVMLSDRWSPQLIEAIRPLSALDNSFPSFHVSMTVVMILISLLYRLPLRWANMAVGIAIIVSTFVLGIHWLADIVAGIAIGLLSFATAVKVEVTIRSKAGGQLPSLSHPTRLVGT